MENTISKIGKLIIFMLLVAMVMPLEASYAESVYEAIADAYERNPGLNASRASARAAQERVRQANAQFGPVLTVDASYAYARRQVRRIGSTLPRQGFFPQVSLSLDQPLFTFGRLSAQQRIAEAGYGGSKANMRAAEQDLIAQVIIAYASVLRDEELVSIARENLTQLEQTLAQIEARYVVRYATETELQQTRSRIFSGQAQLKLAEGNLLVSRNAYRNVTGHYPTRLTALPRLSALPRTVEEAQALAIAFSPILEETRFDISVAKGRVAQARGDTRPYLGLQGSIARAPTSVGPGDSHEVSAQLQVGVTVPIYSGGLFSARVREASQLADGAYQQLEQTSRQVRENVASYWDGLAATRNALPAYGHAVHAAHAALAGAQQQQLAGQITSLDVLDTARDLLTSRQAQAEAEAQLYVQHALLLGAMGRLRVDDFAPDVPLYDPDVYARSSWEGLPTGPLINAIDAAALDDRFKTSPVAVENDTETGHEMPPEPADQAQ